MYLFGTFPLAEYDSSWRMPRTQLFVIQEVLLDNGNGGEDFGVLVAPVRLEAFDARPRLAMDEDHDLCNSGAWWAIVGWDIAYVQVGNASHSDETEMRGTERDYDCYAGQTGQIQVPLSSPPLA